MRYILMLAIGVFVLTNPHADATETSKASSVQIQVDSLARNIRTGAIQKVEILQISPKVTTGTRISPDLLDSSFQYKITISDLRGRAYQSSLASAIKATSVMPVNDSGDLRWAIKFYDGDGRKVSAIYLDATGDRGVINSTAVSFSRNIINWLKSNFSDALK